MSGLESLVLISGGISTAVSAVGTIAAGKQAAAIGEYQQQQLNQQADAERRGAEFQAKQLEIQGKEEQAASQRLALEERRKKKLVLSSLVNRAAGSGFTATDPSTLDLAEDIETYGTYQEQLHQFGGVSRRRELELSAAAKRYSGDAAARYYSATGEIAAATGRAQRNASYFSAASTIAGGISTMASKYNKTRPLRPVGYYDSYSDPTRLGTYY